MKTKKIPELFLRYPGSKAKLYEHVTEVFPDFADGELYALNLPTYCEPFFGSGAIGWRIMRLLSRRTSVIVNDKDVGVAALWKAVQDVPDELAARVESFAPSQEAFYEFKARDGAPGLDTVRRGFEKLVLHQTSFSGLGVRAGGPLGGRKGRSEYNVNCRWRVGRLVRGIGACHRRMKVMKSFEVCCGDFAAVLSRLSGRDFAYLDPPYYVKGGALYKHAFSPADHERLAKCLRAAPYSWVLSYDDCPPVRDLYSWAEVVSFDMTPTVRRTGAPRRKNRELLIRKKQ